MREKLALGPLYRIPMLENVSVDVVDCARVKDVLGVSVRPRSQGRGQRPSRGRLVGVCGALHVRIATV